MTLYTGTCARQVKIFLDYMLLNSSTNTTASMFALLPKEKSNQVVEKWLRNWFCPWTQVLLSSHYDLWPSKCCFPFTLTQLTPIIWVSVPGYLRCSNKKKEDRRSCWSTYPVHLHVLKLEAKVIALYKVASVENLREESLSKSFWLKKQNKNKTKRKEKKRKEIFSSIAMSTKRSHSII